MNQHPFPLTPSDYCKLQGLNEVILDIVGDTEETLCDEDDDGS